VDCRHLIAGWLLCLVVSSTPTGAAQEQFEVPAINFVKAAIESGNYKAARTVLNELLKESPGAVDANFYIGVLERREGNLTKAAKHFRTILVDHPGLHRVRLDLATTLFELQEDKSAEFHFQQLLAADIPDQVRQDIERFLAAIRSRKRYDVNLQFAIAPDTNINAASGVREVTLFGLPFRTEDTEEESGVGITATIGGEYRHRINELWRVRSQAVLFRRDYKGDQFDDMTIRAGVGPQLLLPEWDISLLGVVTRRWYGNDKYNYGEGLRLETDYTGFERWRFDTYLEYLNLHYDEFPFRDSSIAALTLVPSYYISTTSSLSPILGASLEDAASDVFSNTGYRVGLGVFQELPYGISFYIQPEYFDFHYEEEDEAFQSTRHDKTKRMLLSIYRRTWIFFGVSPVFTYIYTDNRSNQELYSYKRHQFQIGFTSRF
jgi:outer membrane protein